MKSLNLTEDIHKRPKRLLIALFNEPSKPIFDFWLIQQPCYSSLLLRLSSRQIAAQLHLIFREQSFAIQYVCEFQNPLHPFHHKRLTKFQSSLELYPHRVTVSPAAKTASTYPRTPEQHPEEKLAGWQESHRCGGSLWIPQ